MSFRHNVVGLHCVGLLRRGYLRLGAGFIQCIACQTKYGPTARKLDCTVTSNLYNLHGQQQVSIMSGRTRRTTAKPASYKEFNETGQRQTPSNEERSDDNEGDQSSLNDQELAGCTANDVSNATENQDNNELPTSTPRTTRSKTSKRNKLKEGETTNQISSEDSERNAARPKVKHGKHRQHDHNKPGNGKHDNKGKKRETNDGVQLFPDSEEDDFDDEIIIKTPRTRGTNTNINAYTTKTPSKLNTSKRISVADRLYMLPTPIKVGTGNTPPLAIDSNYISETKKAEKQATAAKEMLLHAQREAELAKRRLEAEEMRRQTLTLQKEADRTNKKAEMEKIRYEKQAVKQLVKNKKQVKIKATANQGLPRENSNTTTIAFTDEHNNRCTNNTLEHDNYVTIPAEIRAQLDNTHSEAFTHQDNFIDTQIRTAKHKARTLNPLRRSRSVFTGTDGSNNPNVPGQDNGHNAWLDAQLNGEEIDNELLLQTTYAKKNSDQNRMYDIDDIPIRGPPKHYDIPSDISIEEATQIAETLINEDHELYTCRSTGIMKAQQPKQKRRVSSTVTKANTYDDGSKPKTSRYVQGGGNYRSARDNRDEYRYEQDEQNWDTDTDQCDSVSHSSDEVIPKNKYSSKSRRNDTNNFRSPLQLQAERDVERFRQNRWERLEQPSRYRREKERYRDDWVGNERRREERDNTQAYRRSRRSENYNTNRGRRNSISEDNDSRSPKRSKSIKSGINARPESSVCEQHTYPQFSLGQLSGYIGQILDYHKLSYEEFMAGELMTIRNARDPTEKTGRLELLSNIAQWRLRSNVSWPQVRSAYATIVRKVENCEINWEADWDRQERHIYDKVAPSQTKTQKNTRTTSNTQSNEIVWFCRNYQKADGCPKESPHPGRVGTSFKQMYHICAACWLKDKVKRMHPECSNDCPQREQL